MYFRYERMCGRVEEIVEHASNGMDGGDPDGRSTQASDGSPVQHHITDERKNKNRIILLHVRRATRLRANGWTNWANSRKAGKGWW